MFKKLLLSAGMTIGLVGASAVVVTAQMNLYGGKSKTEREVRSEILSLPYYGVFDAIGYQLNGDTVTLNGYVMRPTTRKAAANSVEDIAGIGKVVNNIEVLPLSPTDDRIRRRTLHALTSRGGSLMYYFMGSNPSIRIIVKNGRVTLEGFVDNKSDSDLANILARGVSGTFGVTNNLQVIGKPQ